MSHHRDGAMRVDGNLGGTTSFNPNSQGLWDNQPDFAEPPLPIEGEAAHYDHRVDEDHWEQPGNLFRLMTPEQQQVLFENTARAMGDARPHIKERHVANCLRADPAFFNGDCASNNRTAATLPAAEDSTRLFLPRTGA